MQKYGNNHLNRCMTGKIQSPNKDTFSDKLCTREKKKRGKFRTHLATNGPFKCNSLLKMIVMEILQMGVETCSTVLYSRKPMSFLCFIFALVYVWLIFTDSRGTHC